MPVSKRDKKVSLTKTQKKGMAYKQRIVEEIRKHLENYSNLFVFANHNMRNAPLKDLREQWSDSRFFFAKKKLMMIALGRSEAEEIHKNLHKISALLMGQCGLLFTNRPKDEVSQWFSNFSQMEFARSGFLATETVTLPKGLLPDFTFSIEPHLRSLGLPTQLEKGKVVLREDFTVCREGVRLTPEQASILKLLGNQMAEFKVTLVCMWSKDGSFEIFKLPKELYKVTPKNKTVPSQKGLNNKSKAQLKEEIKSHQEISQLFDQVEITPRTVSETSGQEEETEEEVVEIRKEETETPEVIEIPEEAIETHEKQSAIAKGKTTPKKSTFKSKPVTENADSKSSEIEDVKEQETCALEEMKPRRSMRTPKPIKRTPEEKKQSVKKLTEPNKQSKTSKQTRGTPRQSGVRRRLKPQEESQDVEMAE